MKHKIAAAALVLLAAAFLWQAFAQTETPCVAACKAKQKDCEKEAPDDDLWRLGCL